MEFDFYFATIFYLNLLHRHDRKVFLVDHLKDRGIIAERYSAVSKASIFNQRSYPTQTSYAVALSKRLLMRNAKLTHPENLFFLEDDVFFHTNWKLLLDKITLREDWGVFLLGCQHMERPEVVGPGLVRATYPLDHHAIGIRAEYFNRILRTWRVGSSKAGHDGTATDLPRTNSDVELARLAKEVPMYACFPNIAWQRKDYSDQAERAYSNYTPEGDQLHCREILSGIGAEVLGGKRWQGLPFANQSPGRWDQARLTGMPFKGAGIRSFMATLAEAPLRKPVTHPVLAVLMPGNGKPHHPKIWQAFSHELERDGGRFLAVKDMESPPPDETGRAERPPLEATSRLGFLHWMLQLLRTALEDAAVTHFVFCGEAMVPLMPWREMRRQLRLDGRPCLKVRNVDRLWEMDKPKARRMLEAPRVEKASWRDHSPWALLDRETAGLIMEDDFTVHFAAVEAPEECYFGTVLRLKGYLVEELCAQRDVVWNRPARWKHIRAGHAGEMLRSGCFFGGDFGRESNIAELGLHEDLREEEAAP